MKNLSKINALLVKALIALSVFAFSCADDDDNGPTGPALTGNNEQYQLFSKSDPAVSGMVTFAERDDGVTVITINLSGTSAGGDHPSHIHFNTAAEGGTIAVDLVNVDGSTGISETEVNMLNDGTAISYSQLIDYDGYINVHLSSTDLGTLVAQGDIGQNELMGTFEEYPVNARSDPNISGVATVSERVNGESLLEITLEGTSDGGDHPSHIHANSAAVGGGILVDLTNVTGASGISATNISMLNDGTPITYTELIDIDGYINVHLSPSELSTIIGQGDIGQNALTENFKEYPLNSVSNPNISGIATFSERKNGSALVTIKLEGTSSDGDHPTHIHNNDLATGGGIAVDLTNVNGETGNSATSVTMLNDGTENYLRGTH